MRDVCSFLGEDYEPAMLRLDAARRYDHDRNESDGSPISTAYIGRHRGRVRPVDLTFIQHVAARPMDDFGYAQEPLSLTPTEHARLALQWPVDVARLEVDRLRAGMTARVTAR